MKRNPTICPALVALVAAVALLGAMSAAAREISADEAATAAAAWVAARACAPLDTVFGSSKAATVYPVLRADGTAPIFHIVRMEGGGVVVTSAESGILPVVAFLDADDIEDAPGNSLWEILNADMALRMEQVAAVRKAAASSVRRAPDAAGTKDPFAAEEAAWSALLGGSGAKSGLSSVSDIRVAKLLSTTWNQGGGAANYYTPPGPDGSSANYVCGCVALAGAQIARFWQFPADSRPQVTRNCYVTDASVSKTTMGGTYSWGGMPNTFQSLSAVQKQAIGKLCYDFGVAVHMNWNVSNSGQSGAPGYCLADAFSSVFGYANSRVYIESSGSDVFSEAVIRKTILANLDAGCPVALGIDGHEVVADGYGYSSGTLYTHVNLGWGGSGDAWYNLPTVDTSVGYTSSVLDEAVYNIFPRKTGDLLTGRVLDGSGSPVSGATVEGRNGSTTVTATSDGRGIYALWVTGGRTWAVTASYGGFSGSANVSVTASVSTRVSGTSYVPGTGTVGNSWGNDIVLDSAATPSVPTGVSASDGASTADCTVLWSASDGATSYAVFRHTANNSAMAKQIASGITATSFADTTGTPGTYYFYWVKAVNGAGTSGFSSSDRGYRKLSAPVISSVSESADGVALSWGAVPGATYYRVYRATSADGAKTELGPWQTGLSYDDGSGAAGTTYYYFVRAAVNSSGSLPSDYGGFATGEKTPDVTPAFTGFTLPSAGTIHVVFHAWKNVTYRVQRCEVLGGSWTTVATMTPASTGTVEIDVAMPVGWSSGFVRVITGD